MRTWQPTQADRIAKTLRDAVEYAPRQYRPPEGAAVRIALSNAFLRAAAEKLYGVTKVGTKVVIEG